MTLELLRSQIWQNIYEPSDLDPATDVQYAGGPLLTWVCNEAQRRIASYKFPDGNQVRFRNLQGELTSELTAETGTLSVGFTDTSNGTLEAAQSALDGVYVGWYLEIDGEQREIVSYTGATRTVEVYPAFTTAPIATDTFELYRNWFYLLGAADTWAPFHVTLPSQTTIGRASGNLTELVSIRDLTTDLRLSRGGSLVRYSLPGPGDPTEWIRIGSRYYLNASLSVSRWFAMEYYRMPTDMVNDTDEPEIPLEFHYAIVLWGTEWGYRRMGASVEKYSTKRDFEDVMRTIKTPADIEWSRESDHGTLKRS